MSPPTTTWHDRDDAALVRGCRDGDEAAWGELVGRYARYVNAIASSIVRPVDAEEVFQEVFARLHRQLNSLRDDSAVRPWIAQVTRRAAIDRYRRGRREELVDVLPESVEIDRRLTRIEEAIDVREAMRGLDGRCQEILDRFFARDESYSTIAEALDIGMGTVASRISRCLARLRATLEAASVAASAAPDAASATLTLGDIAGARKNVGPRAVVRKETP